MRVGYKITWETLCTVYGEWKMYEVWSFPNIQNEYILFVKYRMNEKDVITTKR